MSRSVRSGRRARANPVGGLILIALGVLFFLNQAFGINVIGDALNWIWPLGLVAIGIAILSRREDGSGD